MDLVALHLPNPFQLINLACMILLAMSVRARMIPMCFRRHHLIKLRQTRLASTALDRMLLKVRILNRPAAPNCAPPFVTAVMRLAMMSGFGLPAIYKPAILV